MTILSLRRDRWSLSADVMVRVAGLPARALDELQCPEAVAWAGQVLAAEGALTALGECLSDELSHAVHDLDDRHDRRDLIQLRRDVHNLRRPSAPEATLALVARAAPGSEAGVVQWLTQHDHLVDLLARGGDVLGPELARTRHSLHELVADPRMRSGLLLASPDLEARVHEYLATASARPTKRARKVERSAVRYVYRAAAKPSPFSTFTGVVPGRFVDGGADDTQDVPAVWSSRVRVSVVALSRLADAVLADPARRADLPVVPASGWGRDAERVRYVRRSLRGGDTAATVTLDAARDQLFFLRRSDILEDLLETVSQEPAPLGREVAAWLADRLDAAPEDCEHYLAALLELGLLQVPTLATDVHTADPLQAFCTALIELDRPWADKLVGDLDAAARCLDAYDRADPALRRTLLGELRRMLGAAMEQLGAPAELLPSTLVYEDVQVGDEPLRLDAEHWRSRVEGPLRSLERVLPAFDQTLRHRQTLHAFFLARFGPGGRCEDLVSLVHDFHEDIYDEYQSYSARTPRTDDDGGLVGDPNWLASETIEALDSARRLFADGLGRLVAARPEAAEVAVDEDLLDTVADALGAAGPRFTATTHFLQQAGELVVHNSAYGGLAFPFSRFTHWYDDELGRRLRVRAREITPRGAVLAEVTGGAATTNLNLHTRLTDHQIVCPGEAAVPADEHCIPLADLVLEHDIATDRLVLRSTTMGREVVPVYLGYLVPQALPAMSRTLLLLSPSATYWLDPWVGAPAAPVRDGVAHRPRVRLGSLVLRRRSWTVPAADLLGVGSGPAGTPAGADRDAHELLAWQRWRRRHGLPQRVFATVRQPRGAAALGPRPKPQLLDFGSPLLIWAFRDGLTEPDASVELTEMLPATDQLHVRSADGGHVAELAVETSGSHERALDALDHPGRTTHTVPTSRRVSP
jgi:hypothetical protein